MSAPADHLPTVTLAELDDHAALLTRVDRKYVVPLTAADDLLRRLADGGARVLDIDGRREFAYRSVYLDTPDLLTYRQAARRRPRRFKVRTRSYLDTDEHWLEVKVRDRRGRTVKERLPRAEGTPASDDDAVRFTREVLARHHHALPGTWELHPVLMTTYRRATVWLPRDDARLTLDTLLECHAGAGTAVLPRRAVVETKTQGTASAADRLLWAAGHRPVRISKYATAMAALDADLPANRWLPVLRRHPFVVRPGAGPTQSPTTS